MNPIPNNLRLLPTTQSNQNHFETEELSTQSEIKDLVLNLQKHFNMNTGIEIDICAQQIADILQKNPNFNELDLSGEFLDNADVIFKVLENNTTLIKLDLSGNLLDDQSAILIGKALETNNTLETLSLQCNHFNQNGINAIFNSLKKNNALLNLDIRSNNFHNDNAKNIAESLIENSCLTSLDLDSMTIDSKDLKIISEALQNNIVLTNFNCSYVRTLNEEYYDSEPDGWIRQGTFFVVDSDYESDSNQEESIDINEIDFKNEYAVIQSICARNKDKEVLLKKVTPVLKKLSELSPTSLPAEITKLIAQQLVKTEFDAATLRRIGDLV